MTGYYGDLDLDRLYEFTIKLAKDAGDMLLSAVNARCNGVIQASHIEKESAVDIVTQTDEGECFPIDRLRVQSSKALPESH